MRARAPRSVDNLPAELTSFVGRRHELKEAKRLLAGARLLTLTGTGGVGKTRLALRVAADARRAFPDGVWLVELADLRDPALLANTVATALGLRGTTDAAAGLAEFLADRHLLLVLDNCEHVVDECAALVTDLLGAGGQVRVLATSRHVLRVEGEHILHVEPMAIPQGREPDVDVRLPDAVTLFTERASAVLPDFTLTPPVLAVVTRICARLEGIPLALELAAVRLRTLSVDQLLQRLDNRFALLTSGPRGAPPRRRTLEATIDWSFELCSPTEQRLWARMSVLPGGFGLDAAAQLCGPGEESVLDVVAALVDKSVIIRQGGGFGRHGWYRMLEIVREYGEGKLAEVGGEAEVRARQVEYYVDMARRYRAEGFGPRQLEWLTRLRREHANLRDVLEYCLSVPERAGHALRIVSSLWNFWLGAALSVEGYRYLRRGLEHVHDDRMLRARALHAASSLAVFTGQTAAARRILTELGTLADDLDDDLLRAGHAECVGLATFFSGNRPDGLELLERAMAGFRAAGDPLLVFNALLLLGSAYFFSDDPRGTAAAMEALTLAERHGACWSRGYALRTVAINRWRAGEHREAEELLREAIGLRLPDRALLALLLEGMAWCGSSAGKHERAARLLGCATTIWRLSGARIGETSPGQEVDERCAGLARAALGADAYAAAFSAGAAFRVDEAIRYALGDQPAKETRRPAQPGEPGGLTRREGQIADLVAQGMSNKDIAARLVIGRRTVETHVENILVKLGFTSRTQVGPWLAEQRALSP